MKNKMGTEKISDKQHLKGPVVLNTKLNGTSQNKLKEARIEEPYTWMLEPPGLMGD